VPLDKDEGFVKGHESVAVREHRFFCQLGWGPEPFRIHATSSFGGHVRPANHRYGHQQQAM